MDTEGERSSPEPPALAAAPARPRRKLLPILFLAGGALLASYLTSKSPRDQHVSLVLGAAAPEVTQLEIQYEGADGDLARAARMTFGAGGAPRVVSHEPQLADGDYRLRIDLDTARQGRRSIERRVTLGGGTTQVDLATVLATTPRTAPAPTSP